ncbi:MAG: NAD(P)-dependent oxidoreductase [Candidatus Zixiibacteriota bacterium]|nr:MAG: NAD(P)-dependent oxidoreductase [candidate division Zixibacteria bacterium]
MSCCVLFGGSGFIGTHLARHFLKTGRFDRIHIADIRPTSLDSETGVSYSCTDVRGPIPSDLVNEKPEWIFNLAAIHREPGHEAYEYFQTNLAGARHVCDWAEEVDCNNIYFTSSIAVYGPTLSPTSETSPIRPTTPYGSSKFPAELIHEGWRRTDSSRRLIVSRPGVVYGPGDPGNIMRMIRAIRRGYFAFPGSPGIYKSYAYIFGFIDSVEFFMERDDRQVTYNYVEAPTQSLRELVKTIKSFFGCRAVVLPIPIWLLLPAAKLVQLVFGSKNPVHPVRVRKAAMPTHIIPKVLLETGFKFRYDFAHSLEHWMSVAPSDFGKDSNGSEPGSRLRLVGRSESTESVVERELESIKQDE